jgi:hypothetical protein
LPFIERWKSLLVVNFQMKLFLFHQIMKIFPSFMIVFFDNSQNFRKQHQNWWKRKSFHVITFCWCWYCCYCCATAQNVICIKFLFWHFCCHLWQRKSCPFHTLPCRSLLTIQNVCIHTCIIDHIYFDENSPFFIFHTFYFQSNFSFCRVLLCALHLQREARYA